MGNLWKIIIVCVYIQACFGERDPAPAQISETLQCARCPKKTTTTTHRTTTHSTTHTTHITTLNTTTPHPTTHTNHTSTPHPTTHTNHTSTPHPTTHTNHTSTPHPTTHTNHTSTPHPTTHTNHTSTPHPTTHTNHTSTPHPTTHTNHTSTPHPTTHTNHTSTPHPTTHTNHTSTPHPTTHTNHTSTPHPTTHTNHTSTPHPTTHTNHTTYPPTTVPPSTEYIVNGTTGICLRITASFNISINDTTRREIVIPPAPKTKASGNCFAEKAWLTLTFPHGQLTVTFIQDTKNNEFFLGEVNITLMNTGSEKFDNASLKDMVTPLKHSFSCDKVDIQVTSKVSFSVMNVKAQAFQLDNGNYGPEIKCSKGSPNMTVAIVVGVILVVLILIVVIAYFVARRRSQSGYQPL
ncbi:macrosialin [Hyla sarda]|uniref:macrosialin n=1 Tax=Hyla sarda TaxID=327740 RepID=UPI0024C21FCB|nr:macrosialin [Hyla sarda]